MKIKDNVNKAKLFRELTEIGKKRFEFTCEPDEDLKVFLDGAEQLFKLLRLPVVIVSDFCECEGVQDLHAMTGECRKCGKECTY